MIQGDSQPVEIVGGGLAGLALGLALRRRQVPVTVFEAHDFPRHRVCGEFIAALDASTIARLDLAPILEDALRHREVVWYRRGRPMQTQRLPAPALGISRHRLDARLAEAFVAAGGDLREHTRIALDAGPEGRVFAAGRRPRSSRWFGLKVHARRLPLGGDLEVHLAEQAYVGLSSIEDAKVNLCGLFARRPISPDGPGSPGSDLLLRYLEATGLTDLARRLRGADLDEASFCAVAGVSFEIAPPRPDRICLGDCFAVTPPYTGNGMAMALQSAAVALDPLTAWSQGRAPWPDTVATVNRNLHRRFRLRLAAANLLHPYLLDPRRQRWLVLASRTRLLPFRPLYQLTH
jgi:2-polyprenyl-6-methoxyphenol hydroxylase-like FAD-dependent oxidoreductase